MKWFAAFRFCLLCTLLLSVAAGQKGYAQAYEIKNYTVHIDIHQTYFDVTEKLDVNFNEPRHGIYRFLPLKYRLEDSVENATSLDPWLGYRIYISSVRVPGWHDNISRNNGSLQIKIGDKDETLTGLQHYTIRYRVKNAFLSYRDRSVFYWNLVGDRWDVPIDKLSYTLSLYQPLPLEEQDYSVRTGAPGSQAHEATLKYHQGNFSGEALQRLRSGEALTIQIRFPKDYVQPFSSAKRSAIWFGWFLLPLSMIAVFVLVWRKVGRDRRLTEVVSYLPPAEVDPAMAGFLLDDRSNNNELIALFPHWASKGLMRMQYEAKSHFWKKDEWIFIKNKDLEDSASDYERTLFNGLFSSGDEVKLSSLKDSFYKTINKARTELRALALKSGFYTPLSVSAFHVGQVILLVAGFALTLLLFILQQAGPAIFTILVSIVLLILNHLLLKRTARGNDIFQQVNGFRMFVEKAEKGKLETLLKEDPAYFEKTLGYAVAFNLLEKWARRFDGLLQQPPSWYYGYNGASFHMNSFVSQFNEGMTSMRTVMTSAPSGGGSGGSSGGGFGGGGGGSW